MSAIFGYIGTGHKDKIRAISVALSHRGQDSNGFYEEPELNFSIGHRRSCKTNDKALRGGPVVSANGRYILSFDGAIFNHAELRMKTRECGGAECRTSSDEESFIEAIAALGLYETLEFSLGAFSFCLYDKTERCLYLARDRVGEKSLYYGSYNGEFFFTSDLIALRAAGINPPIDRSALQLYCDHGYYPAPWTIFEGAYKLKSAHVLCVNLPFNGFREPKPYWDVNELVRAAYESPFSGSEEDVESIIFSLLNESVRMRMEYSPAGALLSGGIDSSLIVSLMQSQSTKPVRTFTIGFYESKSNEAQYAKSISKYIGTDHTELYITANDAADVIPLMPTVYTEPFADSSQIPTYFVSKLAKESVPAVITGDGGDELFGGYPKYLRIQDIWAKVNKIPMREFLGDAALCLGAVGLGWKKEKLFRGAKLLKARSSIQAYEAIVRQWNRHLPLVIGAGECKNVLNDNELSVVHASMVFMMMDADFRMYLPDDCAVKIERAASAAGLMCFSPLLDRRVVEFAYKLPVSVKIKSGVHKWPLKQLLYRYIPAELLERPKHGFGIPLHEWLIGPLRDWAEELLDAKRLREQGLLRDAWIREEWRRLLNGVKHNSWKIWFILMFQEWLDNYERTGSAN